LSPSPIRYKAAGSVTGKERSMTASINVKIAVVPPIPSARVKTAAEVNPGDFQNCRNAYLMCMFPLALNYAAKPPELAVAKRKTFLRPIGYKVF
jgi:hypothetical protein